MVLGRDLDCLDVAPKTFEAAYSWVELADWAPSVLAGVVDPRRVKRGVCAAGHKALYSDDWGGLPDKEFLSALDSRLADLRDRLYEKAYDETEPAGSLFPSGRKGLAFQRASPSRSANSTYTTARSAVGSAKARWSK